MDTLLIMKRLLISLIFLLTFFDANATNVIVSEIPGTFDLYKGTKKLSSFPTLDACRAGAVTQAASTFTCRSSLTIKTKAVVVPPPPPPDMHAGTHIDPASIPASRPGTHDEKLLTTGQMPTPSDIGQFRSVCYPTGFNYDDFIVYPGKPDVSHGHTYFGNDSVNANSTLESLLAAGSTCRGGVVNLSAYWQPPIIDSLTSAIVPAQSAITYYKNGYRLPTNTVFQPIPSGLKIVTGNPLAKTTDDNGNAFFTCIDASASGAHFPTIPACAPGNTLWASVTFPQCWNGKDLDSADHRSHMSYPVQLQVMPFSWSCPATHPVALPELVINVLYPVRPNDVTTRWRVASDTDPNLPGGLTLHADYIGLWRADIVKAWTENCNNALKDCAAHMLGDGRVMESFGGN